MNKSDEIELLFQDYNKRETPSHLIPREWQGVRLEVWTGSKSKKRVGVRLYVKPVLKGKRVNITSNGDFIVDSNGIFNVNNQGFISLAKLKASEIKTLATTLNVRVIKRVAQGR